jgi:hypothetical protein
LRCSAHGKRAFALTYSHDAHIMLAFEVEVRKRVLPSA